MGFLKLAVLLVILPLGGCASLTQAPIPVEISIVADDFINLTERGRASPVLLKIYEMSEQHLFQSADFFTLTDDLEKIESDEVIAVHELMLMPGEHKILHQNIQADSHFIGIVAAYRDLKDNLWRSLTDVPPPYRMWPWSLEYPYRVIVGKNKVLIERVPEDKSRRVWRNQERRFSFENAIFIDS